MYLVCDLCIWFVVSGVVCGAFGEYPEWGVVYNSVSCLWCFYFWRSVVSGVFCRCGVRCGLVFGVCLIVFIVVWFGMMCGLCLSVCLSISTFLFVSICVCMCLVCGPYFPLHQIFTIIIFIKKSPLTDIM